MKSFREYLRESEEKAKGAKKEETSEYKAYFKKMLAKYKVEEPSELSKEDKQKFFDEVDAGWKGDDEKKEASDVNESNSDDAKKFLKEFNSAVSMLKDDIKNADKNQDWYVRLEYIKNLISKELGKR